MSIVEHWREKMSTVDRIRIDLQGIGNALHNHQLAVPFYQRSYAWEEKHIRDLFTDVSAAMTRGESEYFLGSIVTTKSDSTRPEVVDGQQRLATVAILIAAVRDYFSSNGDSERASDLNERFLRARSLRTLDVDPRLKLNSADNDFFVNKILSAPDSEARNAIPTRESHRRIQRAAELARDKVLHTASCPNPTDALVDLVSYLETGVRVIWVSVSDESNAFTIFETLNDRGLALAISDLLKNYLFGISGDRVTEVQARWSEMTGILESIDNDEILVDYIRHLWSSKHGLTREKELYSRIKAEVRNRDHAVTFVADLASNARVYAALSNPNHELWLRYNQTARGHMNTLNELRMQQIRPLLLAILASFKRAEVQKALHQLVGWVVRMLIVGGIGGGTIESRYSEVARRINANEVRTASQLRRALQDILPTDAQFKDAFAVASVSTHYLARYYLRTLELLHRGRETPEMVPTDNSEVVNLEHVLPISPSAAWNHVSEEDRTAYAKRIGNLALLQRRINVQAGNDGFAAKKPHYSRSEYELTKEIAHHDQWGPAEIGARQIQLAELATRAWPL